MLSRLGNFLWPSEIAKVSDLLGAVLSLVILVAGCHSLISTSILFQMILIEGWLYADPMQGIVDLMWQAFVTSQLAPKDLPIFPPAFFQAVLCISARVTALNHKHDLVTLAATPLVTASSAFRGKLGSGTWSAGAQQVVDPVNFL